MLFVYRIRLGGVYYIPRSLVSGVEGIFSFTLIYFTTKDDESQPTKVKNNIKVLKYIKYKRVLKKSGICVKIIKEDFIQTSL